MPIAAACFSGEFQSMASAAEQLASNISLRELLQGDRAQEAAVVHARRADPVPAAVVRADARHRPASRWPRCTRRRGRRARLLQHLLGRRAGAHVSIVALGVMPYITASIVVQLGGTLYAPWQALKKEGETGRKKLNQYTRYLTVALTLVQGYFVAVGLESAGRQPGHSRGRRAGHAVPSRRHHQPRRRHPVPDVDR